MANAASMFGLFALGFAAQFGCNMEAMSGATATAMSPRPAMLPHERHVLFAVLVLLHDAIGVELLNSQEAMKLHFQLDYLQFQ